MAPPVKTAPAKTAPVKTSPPIAASLRVPPTPQDIGGGGAASSSDTTTTTTAAETTTTCWDDLVYTLFALSVGVLAIMIALYIAKLQLDANKPHIL